MADHESVGGVLDRLGLSNHLMSAGDVTCPTKPILLKAYCSSAKCRGGRRHDKLKATLRRDGKRKHTPYTNKPDTCPDCGHALFWRRETSGNV